MSRIKMNWKIRTRKIRGNNLNKHKNKNPLTTVVAGPVLFENTWIPTQNVR